MKKDLPIARPTQRGNHDLAEYYGRAQGYYSEDQYGGSEVPLREYFRVVFKYRFLIAAIFAVSVVLSLVYAFTATPLYTAQTTLRISSYEPVLVGTDIENVLQQKSQESTYLETQIQEIKSYSIGDKVLQDETIFTEFKNQTNAGFLSGLFGGSDDSELEQDIDLVSGYKVPIAYIKAYLESIGVTPVRRTSLVKINATSENPQLAAKIANKHSTSYMDWVRENRIQQQARGVKFLRAQADELKEKVADLERELADYAEANSIVAVNKDENITAQKMSQLNQVLTDVTARRIEAENAYKEALKTPNTAGFDDSTTQTVRSELAKLEAEYKLLGEKFTPQYPKMRELKAQIDQLRSSVKGSRKEIVAGLKAKAEAAKQQEQNLIEELEQQKSRAFELSKKQVQYNILNRELTTSRDLLQNILKQIKETSLAVESNTSNVSIVDYAVVPKEASAPRKKLILILGALFGLTLGFGGAFTLYYLDNTVRTPEDVQNVLRLPSLGVVPSFELEMLEGTKPEGGPEMGSERKKKDLTPVKSDESFTDLPVVYLNNPKSLAAEAYRTIRTAILLSQAGEPPRTILVTSAQSSEGKTTSSVNLAASLASAGAKVALIDADLRRPSVSKHLNVDPDTPGVVEVITGQFTIDDVLVADKIKRISLIPSGRIPPNPAELLGSLEMASMLDKLADKFDYVLIDSPPILPVTDSVILSRYVDGVVMVVKGGTTPKKVIGDARDRLLNVGARMLGVLLNDVDITGGDYYYYNRYYHSYYQDGGEKIDDMTA